MTSSPPSPHPTADDDEEPATAGETLDLILHRLLPVLLAAALAARSFVGRWRLLHSKLTLLRSALSDAAASHHWAENSLFLNLLPGIVSTLRSLRSLSGRCLDPSLPAGKLLLQSDLDVAASALSLRLHDLGLLLRSGLLHHPPLPPAGEETTAIVLPVPGPGASRADLALFVRDLFARLQIGNADLKLKALESLLQLLTADGPPKLASLVAAEGDLPALLRLLDLSSPYVLRDQAAAAVALLAAASDASRRALFEEGALGPLLRLLDAGSAALKQRAAAAIEALTEDPAHAWAVAAYGGVPALVAACRPGAGGSPSVQALAAGALKNIAGVDEIRSAMAEEGAIAILVDLLLAGTLDAQKNVALCLAAIAAHGGDQIRESIVREGGLQPLLQLLREASDQEAIEQFLRAIHALSASPAAAKALSASPAFFAHLADIIRRGSTAAAHTAAGIICNLSPPEDARRLMAPCMAALVKMLECSKPASAQEAAAGALVSLLAVRSNRRELAKDEKSVTRLVGMLDPRRDEVGKRSPVAVVLALAAGGGSGGRRRLAEAGACQYLQKLADAEVAGAKKALQRIAGSRLKNLLSLIKLEGVK